MFSSLIIDSPNKISYLYLLEKLWASFWQTLNYSKKILQHSLPLGKKKSFPVFNLVMFTNQCSKKTHIQTIRHTSHHSSKKKCFMTQKSWNHSFTDIQWMYHIQKGNLTRKRKVPSVLNWKADVPSWSDLLRWD